MSKFTSIINVANPSDKSWHRGMFLFSFGAVGSTHVLVYADSVDAGLETAAEWLESNAPGHLLPHGGEDYMGLVREAVEDSGHTMAEFEALTDPWNDPQWASNALDSVEADLTYTEAGYLTSYEWFVREVTAAELIQFDRDCLRSHRDCQRYLEHKRREWAAAR